MILACGCRSTSRYLPTLPSPPGGRAYTRYMHTLTPTHTTYAHTPYHIILCTKDDVSHTHDTCTHTLPHTHSGWGVTEWLRVQRASSQSSSYVFFVYPPGFQLEGAVLIFDSRWGGSRHGAARHAHSRGSPMASVLPAPSPGPQNKRIRIAKRKQTFSRPQRHFKTQISCAGKKNTYEISPSSPPPCTLQNVHGGAFRGGGGGRAGPLFMQRLPRDRRAAWGFFSFGAAGAARGPSDGRGIRGFRETGKRS